MTAEDGTPAAKLAALNEQLKGTALLALLNIKNKPAPDALVRRVGDLRDVVFGLCQHLAADDPIRATALERLKSVELLIQDPLEWHILARAEELRQDPSDPQVRAVIESAFYEEHVPRTVWQSAPPDGGQADLRKSMRLPILMDVELEIAGKRTRCQTQNLSREGVCLEVPAGFTASNVSMLLHLAATGASITVGGDVVWRDAGRVGIAFKIGVPEQNAIDAALQMHFASLQRTVARWREIAPKSGAAIACAELVGYSASALPSGRREHLDRLAAAAQADPGSKDLQIGLAKLRIEEHDYDGAAQALKRVVMAERGDPRYRLLDLTLAQRVGRGGGSKIARATRQMIAEARAPIAVVVMIAFFGALIFAVLTMQSPRNAVAVPPGGIPCASVELLQGNAICFIDRTRYLQIPQKERTDLADRTLHSLTVHGVSQVTVYGANDEGVLDNFDAATIELSRKLGR